MVVERPVVETRTVIEEKHHIDHQHNIHDHHHHTHDHDHRCSIHVRKIAFLFSRYKYILNFCLNFINYRKENLVVLLQIRKQSL